jgi:hypothetical protein
MYTTTELELAAFLKARGHTLTGAKPVGRLVEFSVPDDAGDDVKTYI